MANEDWRERFLRSEAARINDNKRLGQMIALGMILSGSFAGLLGFAIGAVTFRGNKDVKGA